MVLAMPVLCVFMGSCRFSAVSRGVLLPRSFAPPLSPQLVWQHDRQIGAQDDKQQPGAKPQEQAAVIRRDSVLYLPSRQPQGKRSAAVERRFHHGALPAVQRAEPDLRHRQRGGVARKGRGAVPALPDRQPHAPRRIRLRPGEHVNRVRRIVPDRRALSAPSSSTSAPSCVSAPSACAETAESEKKTASTISHALRISRTPLCGIGSFEHMRPICFPSVQPRTHAHLPAARAGRSGRLSSPAGEAAGGETQDACLCGGNACPAYAQRAHLGLPCSRPGVSPIMNYAPAAGRLGGKTRDRILLHGVLRLAALFRQNVIERRAVRLLDVQLIGAAQQVFEARRRRAALPRPRCPASR